MKSNRWDDAKVDTKLYLLLQDLTSVFSGREDFQFVYAYGSAVDLKKKEISGSPRLWYFASKKERMLGNKTDFMLRGFGFINLTNIRFFQFSISKMNKKKHDNFALQLPSLFEDI